MKIEDHLTEVFKRHYGNTFPKQHSYSVVVDAVESYAALKTRHQRNIIGEQSARIKELEDIIKNLTS